MQCKVTLFTFKTTYSSTSIVLHTAVLSHYHYPWRRYHAVCSIGTSCPVINSSGCVCKKPSICLHTVYLSLQAQPCACLNYYHSLALMSISLSLSSGAEGTCGVYLINIFLFFSGQWSAFGNIEGNAVTVGIFSRFVFLRFPKSNFIRYAFCDCQYQFCELNLGYLQDVSMKWNAVHRPLFENAIYYSVYLETRQMPVDGR